jgi:hypothetical protein
MTEPDNVVLEHLRPIRGAVDALERVEKRLDLTDA